MWTLKRAKTIDQCEEIFENLHNENHMSKKMKNLEDHLFICVYKRFTLIRERDVQNR